MYQLGWMVVLCMILVVTRGGQAQERITFFTCGTVRFFGPACAPAVPVEQPAPLLFPAEPVQIIQRESPSSSLTASSPVSPPAPAPDALFTPETVAPTTPPMLLRLFQEPTVTNARAFLAWHRARLARIQEVQALLQTLSTTDDAGITRSVPERTP
jgi:hypothetical protein